LIAAPGFTAALATLTALVGAALGGGALAAGFATDWALGLAGDLGAAALPRAAPARLLEAGARVATALWAALL
jgi:hypothetical protein